MGQLAGAGFVTLLGLLIKHFFFGFQSPGFYIAGALDYLFFPHYCFFLIIIALQAPDDFVSFQTLYDLSKRLMVFFQSQSLVQRCGEQLTSLTN